MSKGRSVHLLLYDILPSIQKIEGFTRGLSLDNLVSDERTKDAILRNIQDRIGDFELFCKDIEMFLARN